MAKRLTKKELEEMLQKRNTLSAVTGNAIGHLLLLAILIWSLWLVIKGFQAMVGLF